MIPEVYCFSRDDYPQQPKEADVARRRRVHPRSLRAVHRYVPGSVAIAAVLNLGSSSYPADKARPVVLVAPDADAGSGWLVATLTSSRCYRSTGAVRPLVFATAINGLDVDGYVWRPKLTSITAVSLHVPIGMVDVSMAETIITHCDLTDSQIAGLRRVAVGCRRGEAA